MSIYRKMRGLPDRKLNPLLLAFQELHRRTFVWVVVAIGLGLVNLVAIGLLVRQLLLEHALKALTL